MMRAILLIMIGLSLYGAEIFTDKATGLVWQDDMDAEKVKKNWHNAKEYCQDLTLEGKSDWRLPTLKELKSIVDINKSTPAIKDGFKNVASNFYWSSSEDVSNSSIALYMNFNSGMENGNNKYNNYYIRCVRGKK